MKTYTVAQLAKLAGISVRALHHYDEIGLLKPAHIGANRYRYYGPEELLRLQQILIHRELDIPLGESAPSSMRPVSTGWLRWRSSVKSSRRQRSVLPNWSGRSTARSTNSKEIAR